jgi:hypothetical protein
LNEEKLESADGNTEEQCYILFEKIEQLSDAGLDALISLVDQWLTERNL